MRTGKRKCMRFAYFDYFGRSACLEVDDDDIPQRREIYDEEKGALVQNDRLTLDVWATSGSSLISEAAFDEVLAKCQGKSASSAEIWQCPYCLCKYLLAYYCSCNICYSKRKHCKGFNVGGRNKNILPVLRNRNGVPRSFANQA